jgi:phenolic acid decarboxylase
MKISIVLLTFIAFNVIPFHITAQGRFDTSVSKAREKNLYIDVHQLEPGKVKYEDVAKAHAKDLAAEKKYGVHFIKYWVNEEKGLVYCLSSSNDSESIRKTHAEAHGLLPEYIYQVTDGMAATLKGQNNFFLDVHYLGAGNVSAKDVAEAHKKDLAVESKYGVNFINYWVDEKEGVVMCLSQAKDSTSIIQTHKEAHGLLPAYVLKVKQGE